MRCKRGNRGLIGIMFALGLLVSSFCPPDFLVAVLAVWVIIMGIACRR